MIDHTLLLKKLEVYGLSTETLQWFTSNLRNRRQLVKLGDKQSNVAETIVSNSSVKTVLQYQFLLDSRRQNTYAKRNKQILNLNSASIKDILMSTKAEKQQETAIERSLFMMRSLNSIKMLN